MNDEFQFDLKARRVRYTDADLLAALQSAAENFNYTYFTSTQYDALPVKKKPNSATITNRFGSWKKSLALIGIAGGRERQYTPQQLIDNLERVWKELGFPPGKRRIGKLGYNISETPYRRHWGSFRAAVEALANYHNGKITESQLLQGIDNTKRRQNIPLNVRWDILKRDNYCCVKCGASPSRDHEITLEIDHIIPVSRGGSAANENLQTLCQRCNQGKKDH